MHFAVHFPKHLRLWATIISIGVTGTPGHSGPDLSNTILILEERFEQGLNRYDGVKGLWSTLPRNGRLMTNAAEAVFLDHGVLEGDADDALPVLHAPKKDGLHLRSARLPAVTQEAVRDYMHRTGQGKQAQRVRYASAEITTSQTWAQTYGYFEIVARFPRGKGRWPAFWLTHAGLGWPPEIDVVEAYGAGLDQPTPKDNTFNTAVFFDARDRNMEETHEVNITNPFAKQLENAVPKSKERGNTTVYNFWRLVDAQGEFKANIYDDFHTYAVMWSPESIVFYFGKDRDSLREVYRTPTPDDVHDPMFLIANDQFTARGGFWSPRPNAIDRVLDPQNAFVVQSVVVRALSPETKISLADGASAFDHRSTEVFDTQGDDYIAPGDGFDVVHLTDGRDKIGLTRSRFNKVISGFGPDDIVTLEGYPFASSASAMKRLTQVGPDVWLPTGADPGDPHTVIFKETTVEAFSPHQFDVKWPVPLDHWRVNALKPSAALSDTDDDGVLNSDGPEAWYTDDGAPVRMVGTAGSDRYFVTHPETVIDEPVDGGVDEIISRIDMVVPANIERAIAQAQGITLTARPEGSRLETTVKNVTLEGSVGNDLFVLPQDLANVRVSIDLPSAQDQLRGFGPNHSLLFSDALNATRADWRFRDVPEGTQIIFSDEDSLLVEGIGQQALRQMIGLS